MPVDKVRASRDGHEFHEVWTARASLQLLRPNSQLAGIAVEGLHPAEQERAAVEAVDIADITLYFGDVPTFQHATKTTIVQFKYSESHEDVEFRASNAKKTIAKFAAAYADYISKYGEKPVDKKLFFELITNRPICSHLLKAINEIAKGKPTKGETKKQAEQFENASALTGVQLRKFAEKCRLIGRTGSLHLVKSSLSSLLIDWSGTNDPIARARLGELRQTIRDKAGCAGADRNLIERTDVLHALGISDQNDLLPCPEALPDVQHVVIREQLEEAISLVSESDIPILVHAAGGTGKTVFMESIAKAIDTDFETVFFDCFGGGAYRSPEDARHLPKHGLVHIANTLAFRGMCDPILPGSNDVEGLLRTFRRRLQQVVSTLSRLCKGRKLAIFIDAIDNAELHARERGDQAFPMLLLESLHHQPIPGVVIVVACRTERVPETNAKFVEIPLRPFCLKETETFLRARRTGLSDVELHVAQARSAGNARVLEYLLGSGRLLDESEIDREIQLDDLIEERLAIALTIARQRGESQEHIDTYLAGLAVLPPPVPLNEYASVHGIDASAVESFASDMRPLLERTNQGLMFRDEPTETLVRDRYADNKSLRRLADSLLSRQGTSVYAARALPGLLHQLGDGERIFQLAFDERIPDSISSVVGKRNVRHARLKAACRHAAVKCDYNSVVHLLLELSKLASVDQRANTYLLDYPDLVIVAGDADATRRLFETRTKWPGKRHSRLTIANLLSGDTEEAHRHANTAFDWICHYRRTDTDKQMRESGPEHLDTAAIAFQRLVIGEYELANDYLQAWQEWYVFEFCEQVFEFLMHPETDGARAGIHRFLDKCTDSIGCLAAALSFFPLSRQLSKRLVAKLARACKNHKRVTHNVHTRDRTYVIQDGLFRASAIALSLGMKTESLAILEQVPNKRPGTWSLRDHYHNVDLATSFVCRVALESASKGKMLHEKDLLAEDLVPVCARINRKVSGVEFRNRAIERLDKIPTKSRQSQADAPTGFRLSYEDKGEAREFLGRRLQPLLLLANALAKFLASPMHTTDTVFLETIEAWRIARKSSDPYDSRGMDRLFQLIGREVALFAISTRIRLKATSVKAFLKCLHEQEWLGPDKLIQIVSILARRQSLAQIAGEQAIKARSLIERENDVEYRTSLYADLARAILPASSDEASTYFIAGYEQMSAIGSGDYAFTNELLWFTASMRGAELDEIDFHALSNICELNMTEEPEKFPWNAFASAMSKAAGVRILAKLSRWDDRSKVSLNCTLLPYLTALLTDKKISAKDAVALNRLANPVELYVSDSEAFAKAILATEEEGTEEIVSELIDQFLRDNQGIPMASTVNVLAKVAEKSLGAKAIDTKYLSSAGGHFRRVNDTRNSHMNRRSASDLKRMEESDKRERAEIESTRTIARQVDPLDTQSIEWGMTMLDESGLLRHTASFWSVIRDKIAYSDRAKYIVRVGNLQHVELHHKLYELKKCMKLWGASSASLNEAFSGLALEMTHLHADDLVSNDWGFSGSQLNEIATITVTPLHMLTIELVKAFAQTESEISGAVWLALASRICPKADPGEGQAALKRILNSESTKLADSVLDGEWKAGLYPKRDFELVARDFIWRQLGSPYSADRWRAAHSLRRFAKFGRWTIIQALVSGIDRVDAKPFNASELPFFFKHARLWLLIALARIALDYPNSIAQHSKKLLSIATDDPHVLIRHFAANALLTCIDSKALTIAKAVEKKLRSLDESPFPRFEKKIRHGGGFYDSWPSGDVSFHLDYDFAKYDVEALSCVFGQPNSELQTRISRMAKDCDLPAAHMHDSCGRDSSKSMNNGLSDHYQTHGQQLAYNSLCSIAGELQRELPITRDSWNEDPWKDWLRTYRLSREDGLWLSDGTDRTPLDVREVLLEEVNGALVLTTKRERLLALAGIGTRIGKEIAVKGSWYSTDGIEVRLSSVLVERRSAAKLAKALILEEPMIVWLPSYRVGDEESEYLMNEKPGYLPWIVCPECEGRLDRSDPYGATCALYRPRLTKALSNSMGIKMDDPFGRTWITKRGSIALRAEAWGYNDDKSQRSGTRLFCTATTLKRLLKNSEKELLLLITLQRYDHDSYRSKSSFTHTVAVVRITETLSVKYYKGAANQTTQVR